MRTAPEPRSCPRPAAEATRAQDRGEKRPISSAPTAVGSKIMRPADNQDARPEPTPMATAKTARWIVTTISAPPRVCMTSGGSSDRTMAPTSQNVLVTTAQRHSRVSAHNSPSNLVVEPRMLGSIARSGAACAVLGMKRLAPQHSRAKTIIMTASTTEFPPPVIATPPVIVPPRIARKVALSTSALPAGNSSRFR